MNSDPKKSDDNAVIDTARLFHGQRTLWIDHDGVRYQLRITRKNKLLLVKPPGETPGAADPHAPRST